MKIEYIKWLDHSANQEGWIMPEAQQAFPFEIESVGYTGYEDEEIVNLIQNVSPDLISNVMTILKACIVERIELISEDDIIDEQKEWIASR
jgi:hypothetical protein